MVRIVFAVIAGTVWLCEPAFSQLQAVAPESATKEIVKFLEKPEPAFTWQQVDQQVVRGSTIRHLKLTSQTWHDLTWQHDLLVYEPAKLVHSDHMLLYITGGANGKESAMDVDTGIAVATACQARVAMLHQVPNQPLLGGKFEDDLITETWLRYLDSGDTSWPLLFPMTKSAVKAMDALEQLAAKESWSPIQGFIVTGASKRGWTTWLTAANDKRVIGFAPMVIDMLNFSKQIKHQYELWGKASEQVHDYTSKNLIRRDGVPRNEREAMLWLMMDPYHYRQKCTQPKLLVVGANDPYWATDAMTIYWDDLDGEKFIYRGANAGHGLEGSREKALQTLAVFFDRVIRQQPLPTLQWTQQSSDKSLELSVSSDQSPRKVTLWVAKSATMDFRKSVWTPSTLISKDDQWQASVPVDNQSHAAAYIELTFDDDGRPFTLSTLAFCR